LRRLDEIDRTLPEPAFLTILTIPPFPSLHPASIWI
jgi:hypothetical protein